MNSLCMRQRFHQDQMCFQKKMQKLALKISRFLLRKDNGSATEEEDELLTVLLLRKPPAADVQITQSNKGKTSKEERTRIRRKNKRKVRPVIKKLRALFTCIRELRKDRENGRRILKKNDLPGKDMEQYFDVLAR